jgi:DNA polymerase III subunit epsilon
MLADFPLDAKSRTKLATEGLTQAQLQKQLGEEDIAFTLELWRAQGVDVIKKEERYFFATTHIPLEDAIFCIVDVETNGSKIEKHQIIEIGAVKVSHGMITDTFESLVFCNEINEHITAITGITADDTRNAPSLPEVMRNFKYFLQDAVFVAHDVKFDFQFISATMEKVGLAPLLNRHLCSIDLAERTIESYRYGLAYLNDFLELYQNATHHRALSDAMTAAKLFLKSLKTLDEKIQTVEDVIWFSRHAKRLKRLKSDPLVQQVVTPQTPQQQ